MAREPEKAGIECISHGGSGETWLLRRGSVWDGSRGFLWVNESVSVHHILGLVRLRVLSMSIQAI